jgi:hypothetical protein
MPRRDLPVATEPGAPRGRYRWAQPFRDFLRNGGKRKRDRDLDDGGVLVEPDKPRNLSGGAAAALEFDD